MDQLIVPSTVTKPLGSVSKICVILGVTELYFWIGLNKDKYSFETISFNLASQEKMNTREVVRINRKKEMVTISLGPYQIFLVILVTSLLDIVLILWGKILSWSLREVNIKGSFSFSDPSNNSEIVTISFFQFMHTTSLAFIFSWLARLNDIVSNEYLSFFKPTQKQNSVTPRITQIFHTLPIGLVTVDGCSLLIKKHMALFQYKLTSHYA